MSEYVFWDDMWNVPSTSQPEEPKKDTLWSDIGKSPTNINQSNS